MPQLPLEALILKRGGFLGLPAGSCSELSYFHLTGGSPAGRVRLIEKDPVVLVDEVEQGLTSLITAFDDAETPYLCLSDFDARSFYDDYEHLARIREWS